MEFCPECGCQLEFTSGVIMCTNCGYSECNCELCSSQDQTVDIQTGVKQISGNNVETKGDTIHVEQTD